MAFLRVVLVQSRGALTAVYAAVRVGKNSGNSWATHQAEYVSRKNKNQFVPWKGLMTQFGCDYTDQKDFRKKAIAALKKIQTVYPGLKLEDAERGCKPKPPKIPSA